MKYLSQIQKNLRYIFIKLSLTLTICNCGNFNKISNANWNIFPKTKLLKNKLEDHQEIKIEENFIKPESTKILEFGKKKAYKDIKILKNKKTQIQNQLFQEYLSKEAAEEIADQYIDCINELEKRFKSDLKILRKNIMNYDEALSKLVCKICKKRHHEKCTEHNNCDHNHPKDEIIYYEHNKDCKFHIHSFCFAKWLQIYFKCPNCYEKINFNNELIKKLFSKRIYLVQNILNTYYKRLDTLEKKIEELLPNIQYDDLLSLKKDEEEKIKNYDENLFNELNKIKNYDKNLIHELNKMIVKENEKRQQKKKEKKEELKKKKLKIRKNELKWYNRFKKLECIVCQAKDQFKPHEVYALEDECVCNTRICKSCIDGKFNYIKSQINKKKNNLSNNEFKQLISNLNKCPGCGKYVSFKKLKEKIEKNSKNNKFKFSFPHLNKITFKSKFSFLQIKSLLKLD